ncbi:TFIIA-alpha and beta-like factor [Dunckerocampus dactyliophorus]|uniref:TFIIA-alpha and beta-like factor n=1 Tax=Dunckerocampus dactyliophorus TaxID=161453 RepID=UPI002404B6A5|nr:TFIIA-alpha and beta-like factor [Dunckerocampus dactyliophorus]
MLTNMGPVAKLYLSIIDDVIESMRELFLDEGLEDRVLDDLRHLWETKMIQSKAMDDFRKTINSPNFVLQLPANYSRSDAELRASVASPASQNMHSFPAKNNSEAVATFSLPAGLSYPVQIPAGVTLQTASGQLYKVNVPVVVTQAPAGQQTLSKPPQNVIDRREPPAVQPSAAHPEDTAVPHVPTSLVNLPQPHTRDIPENRGLQQEAVTEPPLTQTAPSPEPDYTPEEDKSESNPEPVDLSLNSSSVRQLFDFQIGGQEALTANPRLKSRDIDDILKEVIEEEREKATRAGKKSYDHPEAILGLDMEYNYSELSDIIQLDGHADNSDLEEEEEVVIPLEENDFLGMINAEAIKALQEGCGSSDGNSSSCSSDSDGADELEHIEDKDPLNSGDDVVEQDIPDLFDIENVIVCQYDKIHRSKNRWKFHLKDGVVCYGGRDYVFSKAVGEAEWRFLVLLSSMAAGFSFASWAVLARDSSYRRAPYKYQGSCHMPRPHLLHCRHSPNFVLLDLS